MRKYIFIFSIICLSCQHKTETLNNEKLLVEIQVENGLKNKVEELKLSDVAADIEIIPLETNNESVIGYIFNMATGNESLIFNEMNRVSRFSRTDGKFINTIGKLGTGPTDFYYCEGVGLDESKQYIHLFTSPEIL